MYHSGIYPATCAKLKFYRLAFPKSFLLEDPFLAVTKTRILTSLLT